MPRCRGGGVWHHIGACAVGGGPAMGAGRGRAERARSCRARRDGPWHGSCRAGLPADAPSRRLPSRASLSPPTTAAPEPERFHRVTIEDAGHFRVGTRRIALAGIAALGADATCGETDAQGARPCGRLAAAAVRRFVRARALDCEPCAAGNARRRTALPCRPHPPQRLDRPSGMGRALGRRRGRGVRRPARGGPARGAWASRRGSGTLRFYARADATLPPAPCCLP